jgi:serine/threonine-protein kinase RsbT
MDVVSSEICPVHTADDVVRVRQRTRLLAISVGFNLVEQTKIVTASSEIARNTLVHGGGGQAVVEVVRNGSKSGLRLTFEDRGAGIPDIELAMKDGYTSRGGMGHGLGGAKRLTHEFDIQSKPGEGTRVSFLRWKGL